MLRDYRLRILLGAVFSVFALAAFSLLSGPVYAATPPDTCFDFDIGTGTIVDYYDNEDNNGANSACTKNVDIPTAIAGTPVVAIGNNSFSNKSLTSVTIPNSVLSVGNSAFHTNTLTSLSIGNAVETIDSMAFYNTQLTSVVIPNSVTTIGSSAFAQNQISSLTLGDSLVTIGSGAFESNALVTVVIPNSVTTIEELAFRFNYITSLTLGNAVDSIPSLAFGINKIQTVNIPDSVTSISPSAFAMNSSYNYEELTSKIGGGDVDQVNLAYASIYFVKLYTADPSNPNNLQDSVLTEGLIFGDDNNLNGNQDDVLGGHRINPSEVSKSVSDKSNSGSTLASTGENVKLLVIAAAGLVIASGVVLVLKTRQK